MSFWYICLLLLLTSCLQEKAVVSSSSGQSWFEGVVSARNTGGASPSIVVSWNAANIPVQGYKVYTLVYDPFTKTNKMENVFAIDSETLTYAHSQNVVTGAIYTFMVRAVDGTTGKEDTNSKQVSTMAFAGIDKVEIKSATTAEVTLDSSTGAFDEVRVYAQPVRQGGAKIKVATATGAVRVIPVTGLQSGVKYKFSVNAYMSYLNAEDGNTHSVIGQTWSSSFGSGLTPSNPDDQSGYQYRGMLAVQAYGDSPNSAVAPTQSMIRLTWLPFFGATTQTTYRVIRTQNGNTIDTTTSVTCTAATDDSCIVACGTYNMGAGTQTCEDLLVSPPPKTYNYVVSLVKTANGETWVEELPTANPGDFITKVAVPPTNMVLVHRDAANYEMCQMMSANPNPRKHQRCAYTGIAAKPYNNGPGKPPRTDLDEGFYDFGYNLFVDRYSTACNWTRVSASCGVNGCIGITSVTTSAAAPSTSLGVDGNVFFALNGGYGDNCFYKKGGNWLPIGNVTSNLTTTELETSTTVDPHTDYRSPAVIGVSQGSAFSICDAHPTEYGNKRLLRRRELVHASAFATMSGEHNAVTDKIQQQYLRTGYYNSTTLTGGQLPGYRRCAADNNNEASRLAMPTTLLDLLNPLNFRAQINIGVSPMLNIQSRAYFIGTVATSSCISRWGSQDPIASSSLDSANVMLSDAFVRTNDPNTDPATFAPLDSDYDSGVVRDYTQGTLTYQFNNVSGPAVGVSSNWTVSVELSQTTALTYQSFILPMGLPALPAITTQPYNAYKSTSALVFNGTLGASIYGGGSNYSNRVIYRGSGAGYPALTTTRYVMVQGERHRFAYTLHPDQHQQRFGVWCALEAE